MATSTSTTYTGTVLVEAKRMENFEREGDGGKRRKRGWSGGREGATKILFLANHPKIEANVFSLRISRRPQSLEPARDIFPSISVPLG